ncbi:uncharacterized protein YbcI [Geomicrobium halophilum]|uniref:Uncharacterized protein YbcI n=1 Tax=Geomicrobium halophilum TaxID=549000 RepID=A0A841PLZ0_9BACL|nr:Na-translocating system protein MpsC family protein [Geomicrobium halophilum]MBB6448236.1 uncharacterized protein YbcI [Geomicrobium halophilum]
MEVASDPKKTTLKKNISQLYNKVNQEMYGVGVKKQKIEILKNTVVIFSEHKRAPDLKALDHKYREITMAADAALISEFKKRLKWEIQQQMSKDVHTVLKDFDPESEFACTVIHFKEENF